MPIIDKRAGFDLMGKKYPLGEINALRQSGIDTPGFPKPMNRVKKAPKTDGNPIASYFWHRYCI
jgi:hypothetical protein